MVKILGASGGRTKRRSAGRCTRDGRVCAPERKKKKGGNGKREEERERERNIEKGGKTEKAERKGRDGRREMAHTVAATTSYTNATSY